MRGLHGTLAVAGAQQKRVLGVLAGGKLAS